MWRRAGWQAPPAGTRAERGPRAAAVLEALLPALSRKGLAVVTLSELVATARDAAPRPGGVGIGCPGREEENS